MASPEKTSPLAEKKKGPYDLGKAIRDIFRTRKEEQIKNTRNNTTEALKKIHTETEKKGPKKNPVKKINKPVKNQKESAEKNMNISKARIMNEKLRNILGQQPDNKNLLQQLYGAIQIEPKYTVDSPEFAHAVVRYQKSHPGLTVDGWIQHLGPTWQQIMSEYTSEGKQKITINTEKKLLQFAQELEKNPKIDTNNYSDRLTLGESGRQNRKPLPKVEQVTQEVRYETTGNPVLSDEELTKIQSIKDLSVLGLNSLVTNKSINLSNIQTLRTISFLSISKANNFYPDMLPSGLERMYLSNMSVAEAKQIDFSKFTSLKKIRLSDPDGWKEYTPEGLKNK